MVKKETIIFIAFAAAVFTSEIEDSEQKKRGATKASTFNAIPSGSQKPDYTYNLYSQGSGQSNPSQSYQSEVQPSFYPNQAPSVYYTSASTSDVPTSNPTHTQVPTQPNYSQFVPINFIPNPGYQSKYQIVPQKQNVQLAILQQPTIPSSSILQYPQSFFTPNPTNQINNAGQGHFGFPQNYQLPVSGHFIGQPSMIVLPQTHPTPYNNLVYPNPTQSFYNYYPLLSQSKYSYIPGAVSSSNEYDKVQPSVPQTPIKEGNGIGEQNSEYLASDSKTYKSAYTSQSNFPKK